MISVWWYLLSWHSSWGVLARQKLLHCRMFIADSHSRMMSGSWVHVMLAAWGCRIGSLKGLGFGMEMIHAGLGVYGFEGPLQGLFEVEFRSRICRGLKLVAGRNLYVDGFGLTVGRKLRRKVDSKKLENGHMEDGETLIGAYWGCWGLGSPIEGGSYLPHDRIP